MSQYIGEAFVKITPDTRGFAAEVDKGVNAGVKGSATGARAQLRAMAADTNRIVAENRAWLASQRSINTEMQKTSGLTARSAIGFGVLGIAARNLTQDFAQWAKTQGDVVAGLGGIAQGITNLDLKSAGQGIGQLAFGVAGSPGQADANAATKRDADNQNAIQVARDLLDLRERAAKAEGEVGTAAGRARFELEKQLRIANLQFNALTPSQKRIAAGQFGLNPDLSNKVAVSPTDASRASGFDLNSLRAQQTKTLSDDRRLFEDRRNFLQGQIKYLEAAGAHSAAAKDRLKTLYGQLESVDGQIQAIEDQARAARQERLQNRLALQATDLAIEQANARTDSQTNAALAHAAEVSRTNAQNKNLSLQERRNFELEAAQAERTIFENQQAAAAAAEAERQRLAAEAQRKREEAARKAKEEIDARRRAYRDDISLEEQKIGLQVQRAQLTEKSIKDDQTAIKAQIALYHRLAQDHKLTDAERLGFRSQEISARLSLQSLKKDENLAPKSSASDFFREAASQFTSFGSNIATAGGVLSGQDARASFAARALSGSGIQAAKDQSAQQTRNAQLAEAQKHTELLKTIANRLTYGGATGDPPAKAIANARRGAHIVQAAT